MKFMLKKLLSVSVVTLIISTTAHATNGLFFSLQSGVATQSGLPSAVSVGANSLETNLTPLALRFGLGYNHDLTPYLGLGMNVGWGRYGESVYHYDNGSTDTIKSQTLEFFAILTGHLQKFDLTGKIGGVRQQTDVDGVHNFGSGHHNNPAAGIELAYNFSKRFAAIATYQHVFGGNPQKISDIPNGSVSISEYLLGLRYTFASS